MRPATGSPDYDLTTELLANERRCSCDPNRIDPRHEDWCERGDVYRRRFVEWFEGARVTNMRPEDIGLGGPIWPAGDSEL